MGNSKDLSEDEIAEAIENKGIIPQIFYKDAGYKLDYSGTEKVGSNDAYKVTVTSPSGKKSTEYYDVHTGYLVKNNRTRKANGQEVEQSIEYSNYKKVGNIMFPFTNTVSVATPAGAQEFTVDIDEVKLNSGVSAEDFK